MCKKLKINSSTNFEDIDKPISYTDKFDEYSLKIFDGGSSSIVIQFYPFCRKKYPNSKRNEWFDEIERLGINP